LALTLKLDLWAWLRIKRKVYTMKKILCVDDNPDFLELMEHLITSKGFDVQLLDKGEDTESAIRGFKPDLVLLDIVLGNIDGREVCNKIKASSELGAIPIIMVSAVYGVDLFVDIPYKADDFITKPFVLEEFYRTVNTQLSN